jgi:threonyl-tRNA synthetase
LCRNTENALLEGPCRVLATSRHLIAHERSGLRGVLEVEGSLGARVRASRQRRDRVIAVVGEKEVIASEVQVVDVSAEFRGSIPRSDLVDLLSRSYADRVGNIDWPRNASASAAPV